MTPTKAQIRCLIEDADIVPLTMALVQIDGDLSLLDEVASFIRGPWDYSQEIPDALASSIRDRLAAAMIDIEQGREVALPRLEAKLLQQMLGVAVGDTVDAEYVPMLREQIGFERSESWDRPEPVEQKAPVAVGARDEAGSVSAIIVGAGVSGVCAAVRLQEAGVQLKIFEKNTDVGGTWFENRYPGCAVDTPNHFYQFSFAPNNDWPRYFSQRKDIQEYIASVADWFGVRDQIRFSTEVISATYDTNRDLWVVVVTGPDGETVHEARILVTAVGQLNRPAYPKVDGLERFKGRVVHTAEWDDTVETKGKQAGLIGTGASAVQIGPGIVEDVASLHVFQRSGGWVVRSPNATRTVSEGKKWALQNIPFYAAWYRFQLFWGFGDGLFPALKIDDDWDDGHKSINALNSRLRGAMLKYFERQLHDRPDLLEKVVPDYPPYGKRVLADAGWFEMLKRDHVSLETAGVSEVTENGIRTGDDRFIPLDLIVLATGFQASKMLWPMEITGSEGTSIRELWGDADPRAYVGTTVEGFPNFFVLYGPNTGLGHGGSVTFLAECQMNYVVGCVKLMQAHEAKRLSLRGGVQADYNERMDAELSGFVWSHPSVNSWYRNSSGRVTINQPWRLVDYWNMTRSPDPNDYDLT